MDFFLRTFGALELLTTDGAPVGQTAAQRKPLLILALAGLTPGGIPRERLLRALWPDTPIGKAQASLKQHLYALRRATGNPNLITGSPRLHLAESVRVDALELREHVEHGRISEAARLLTGELVEQVDASGTGALAELVRELRRYYAPTIAMVRAAIATREEEALLPPLGKVNVAIAAAERELQSACRRFVHGMVTLPGDSPAGYHRTGTSVHDLLEGLAAAESAGVPPERTRELIEPARELWGRSILVQRLRQTLPGEPPDVETLEWCITGGARTLDPLGRALERWVLGCGLAGYHRQRLYWQTMRILRTASRERGARILSLASGGARDLRAAIPLLLRPDTIVVVNDRDNTAVAVARMRLSALGERLTAIEGFCYERMEELAKLAPYDLILTGGLLEHLTTRHARWLVPRLLELLTPEGQLCLSNLSPGTAYGGWIRYVIGVECYERQRDDVLLLLGPAAPDHPVQWDHDALDEACFATIRVQPRSRPKHHATA